MENSPLLSVKEVEIAKSMKRKTKLSEKQEELLYSIAQKRKIVM
jgi:hypothetical protein